MYGCEVCAVVYYRDPEGCAYCGGEVGPIEWPPEDA